MLTTNIDEVIKTLDLMIAEAASKSDSPGETLRDKRSLTPRAYRIGLFAALYRQVTLKIRIGMESNHFDDCDRMNRFAAKFANRYFIALDTYRSGGKPTKSWKVAFEAASQPDFIILQHLLLGINAHINLDLGIVAAEICPGEELQSFAGDFEKINNTIADLLNPNQEVVSQFSPLLEILDKVGGITDEAIVSFSIKKARQQAWNHAQILALQTTEQQQSTIISLDQKVAFLGRIIASPSRIIDKAIEIVKSSESNDIPVIIDALNRIVYF
ncbi:DUF5995 family protein [Brunnivagina elsteri]|uniref:Uncharacterized protein n=1 Tax=Brunnivagina elsteri CCALA 953 TaxID=987040 RepID=A0A2A2TG17_9CYAN|nr:DUF5995 family protein [Calothrix elsteri]PAX52684.1 hypothetical protein CK510_17975 [Calothrix elsteri CCALA 953]